MSSSSNSNSPKKRERGDNDAAASAITIMRGEGGTRVMISGPINGLDDFTDRIKMSMAVAELGSMLDKQLDRLVKTKSAESQKRDPVRRYGIMRSIHTILNECEKPEYAQTAVKRVIETFFEGSSDLRARIRAIYDACSTAVTARTPQAVAEAKAQHIKYSEQQQQYTEASGNSAFHVSMHDRMVSGWSLILGQVESELAEQTAVAAN